MQVNFTAVTAYVPPAIPEDLNSKKPPAKYFFRTSCSRNRDIYVSQDSGVELGRYTADSLNSEYRRIEFLNPYISKIHAIICSDERGVFLVDVGTKEKGSKHGTYLNGEKVLSQIPYYLSKGDLISLGNPKSVPSIQLVLVQ